MPAFSRTFTVHWNECDPARIVFHANFIRWMDEGFSDWASWLGIDFPALQAADSGFVGCPLVSVRCGFSSPVHSAMCWSTGSARSRPGGVRSG